MVTKHLGYAIDICCGGIDNLYRHHDYNIAVIEAASGKEFAPYWVHGEHLLVNGKKMSKSLGHIVYPDDLLTEGFTGQHVRFYLLYGHHRKRINFTPASFQNISEVLDRLRAAYRELVATRPDAGPSTVWEKRPHELATALRNRFESRMNDDLDVRGAIDSMGELLTKLVQLSRTRQLSVEDRVGTAEEIKRIDTVLQVIHPV